MRTDRFRRNPAKDRLRVVQLEPYRKEFQVRAGEQCSTQGSAILRELRWMLEEFRISLFAQELGTAQRVSAKRLERQLEAVEKADGGV